MLRTPALARPLARRAVAAALLAPLLLAAAVPAADAPTVLRLEPYVAGLVTLSVDVGGRPSRLIFDTAGGLTLVTPQVAAEIGCRPFGRLTGFRHDGGRLDLERCGPLAVAAGPLRAEREVAVFDLMALLGGAPPVDGIVGLDLFETAPVTIDLEAGEVTFETPASLAARSRDAARLAIRLARQAGGAGLDLFVAAESPQGLLWLEWDSGNSGPVRLAPHAVRQLGWELSAEASSPRELDVAGLGPVAIEALEKEMIYDGLLNNRFVRDFVWTLDLANGALWAKRRVPAPKPAE
jgi:hypothetical protein